MRPLGRTAAVWLWGLLAIWFADRCAAYPPPAPPEPSIDAALAPYYSKHGVQPGMLVADGVYAQRVYLDLIGLLPTPEELSRFTADNRPQKRSRLVDELLGKREAYAAHWLTFWNDALRNAYRGTGYIDGGRKQITGWLYGALYTNMPYDQFVRELVNPAEPAEGFIKGIRWRGVVNASQRPEMQAAQNISQVFLGTNLKCASCHDSFVSDWALTDAYGMASVFADEPLEIHECDRPTGHFAEPKFIFDTGRTIDPKAARDERMRQLAEIISSPEDERLAATIVNRLWAQLMGRGIVEPVDAMEEDPFWPPLLAYLASDLASHRFDLKHTLRQIATSQAYQLPSVGAPAPDDGQFVFRGPIVRRMSGEQFVDALSMLAGPLDRAGQQAHRRDGRGQGGQLAVVAAVLKSHGGPDSPILRAALLDDDPLTRALGRPNREQVVTRRDSIATTLQALEMSNGATLDGLVRQVAVRRLAQAQSTAPTDVAGSLVDNLYRSALGREPNAAERAIGSEILGKPVTPEAAAELVWAVVMLPEFQLIE